MLDSANQGYDNSVDPTTNTEPNEYLEDLPF